MPLPLRPPTELGAQSYLITFRNGALCRSRRCRLHIEVVCVQPVGPAQDGALGPGYVEEQLIASLHLSALRQRLTARHVGKIWGGESDGDRNKHRHFVNGTRLAPT